MHDCSRRTFLKHAALGVGGSLLAGATGSAGCSPASGSAPLAHPFRPPAGSAYLLAGQSSSHIGGLGRPGASDGYLDNVAGLPSGLSLYVQFPEPDAPAGFRPGTAGEYADLPVLDDTLLHLSVAVVSEARAGNTTAIAESEQAVLDGVHDLYIDELAAWCAAQPRPILLRLAYEFDRPLLQLATPERYAAVFRYVVDRVRAAGATNVAFVWASSNLGLLGAPPVDFDTWYPGDDAVDWFGFSMWFPTMADDAMLEQARARNKPVLLCETTPVEFNVGESSYYRFLSSRAVPLSDQELWDGWWQPMLDFVAENSDVVGGWHYIAQDWRSDPLWSGNVLFRNCDARVWANDYVLRRWTQAASSRLFVRPRPGLFRLDRA